MSLCWSFNSIAPERRAQNFGVSNDIVANIIEEWTSRLLLGWLKILITGYRLLCRGQISWKIQQRENIWPRYICWPCRTRLWITWSMFDWRRRHPSAPVCLDRDKVRKTHARKHWVLSPCQTPNIVNSQQNYRSLLRPFSFDYKPLPWPTLIKPASCGRIWPHPHYGASLVCR